jgi:hypothetical protein
VQIYSQLFNTSLLYGASALNYSSPYLHHAVMTGLVGGTRYYYKVGDGKTFSAVKSFVQPYEPGQVYPQRFLLVADWGTSYNSSATLQHILYSNAQSSSPAVVFYIGDFCYADTWYPNGTKTNVAGNVAPHTASGEEGAGSSTYQPVWDEWLRLIEPLLSETPMLGCVGNHEVEQQTLAPFPTFTSVQARFKWQITAAAGKASGGTFFYFSSEIGPVHAVFVSPYTDYTPGGVQYNWVYSDMMNTNRSITPFVVVNTHHPWFSTDPSYKEHEHMRVSLEPVFYEFGADIFYYGHVHAYERTSPMYNFQVNHCGSVHITIGDGGNAEGSSFFVNQAAYALNPTGTIGSLQFEDLNGGCPNYIPGTYPSYMNPPAGSGAAYPFPYYKRVYTFQADGNSTGGFNITGFCYAEQPIWSQLREPSFGHGTLDILSDRTALWSWHRNQDGDAVTADSVYITRDPVACPNKAGYAPYSAAATSNLPTSPNA